MQSIFQSDIQFKFDSLYMGALTSEKVSCKVKYLFWILSAASRKAITRRLLKPGKPTVEVWIDIIDDIFKMERITFALRLQQFCEKMGKMGNVYHTNTTIICLK